MKYVRRLIWYTATRLLALCCILGLMTLAFYYSMNASNIYILLKDGMARRAQCIMMGTEEKELVNYFASNYLERDDALNAARSGQSSYQNFYDVTGFDHRLNMSWMWCWPWEDTARATIEERIPAIDGKLKASARDQASALSLTSAPPKWQSARYQVILARENGHWRIRNLTLIQLLTDE